MWTTRLRCPSEAACPQPDRSAGRGSVGDEEAVKFAAGRIEGALLMFGRAAADQGTLVVMDGGDHDSMTPRRRSRGSSCRRRISSPPRSHRLSRCRRSVLPVSPALSRCRKNGAKQSTIARPGARSRGSTIQLAGHRSRSGQRAASRPARRRRNGRRPGRMLRWHAAQRLLSLALLWTLHPCG